MGLNYKVHKQWLNTPKGRASTLLNAYNNKDKKQNRGKGNLTSQWIVENILFKPCAHCGKEGWKVIGCNRLDNTKPHTMDNVEPCCMECNVELSHPKKQLAQIDPKTNEIVKIWKSTMEARRNGFFHASCVANGRRKQDKGYIFEFI